MSILTSLIQALWKQDYVILEDPTLIWTLYLVLFLILFLENGLLPTSFLPGDSLLILVGTLIAEGAINCVTTLLILTTAASLGYWVSYLQGRWLGNTYTVKKWLSYLPLQYHKKSKNMFHQYGLSALFLGRFIAFVRTILPVLAGLSGLNHLRFQFFNWTSSFLWVLILIMIGFMFGQTPVFHAYANQLICLMMILPLAMMFFGLIGSLYLFCRKKYLMIKK
ncbi:Inner membrane protein YqjA [Candidatus Erwinia haradaeae]|uniref:Inner membrane protein YqjA n=1 Tax=Candidatus Erwinia haradaeae TaxID=1922217 RepID=A0A451CZ32_9GAMM|nr:DedA family protein [Candidatus Erwinia haradaeae]VFP78545.1 Inner membrane protein YqjA [Candidatus Erwinia haradaeae]